MKDTEFNPTKKDLLTIDALIIDIKSKKTVLINRKISLQNSLSVLREKYKDVSFQSKDFKRIGTTRQNIKDHLNGIELKIQSLNQELKYKTKLRAEVDFHVRHIKTAEADKIINKINALKSKYSDFTKDRTRIASLRIMASEFISELENLIK